MKHLIMGTAGHIDHGKTALIKALTGIECDTHREEKERGITINLGFAHIELPSGNSVGIVDVPGHRDFVHTMVAGASGIDFALMVVAADEGVMPQTREHLQIMNMLGIRAGVIALTKTDLVGPEVAALAAEEVRGLVRNTFLERAAVVPVSAATGGGLPALGAALDECATRVAQRPRGEVFRMFVDRIFSKAGFGTVVTGSVLSGSLATGDRALLLPPGKDLRVRVLQRHGRDVPRVAGGDRASLNLVGLDRRDFRRGMAVADRALGTTTMVDAQLHLFADAPACSIWAQAIFLLGTYEAQARIHLLDTDTLGAGQSALVQIHLPEPCVAVAGDPFVLRSSSSECTLGGGRIIDAAPLHHRRRRPELVRNLRSVANGDLIELIAMEARKRRGAVTHSKIADALNVAPDEIANAVASGVPGDLRAFQSEGTWYVITAAEYERLSKQIAESIAAYHQRNPLLKTGRTVEEMIGILGMAVVPEAEGLVRLLLADLEARGMLKRAGRTYSLSDHRVEMDKDLEAGIAGIESFLAACRMKVPLAADLSARARELGMDDRILNQVLRYLVANHRAYQIEGTYIHAGVVDTARRALLAALDRSPEGLTVAEFRDLIAGNRKMCLLLYALFDREGSTRREGDVRIITGKGRDVLAEQT
ncbi:MAG: selenocysteine-specific translation elongation factor [Chitinivibrionales bacterium]|nr:selenocysteine-specific translation elongation factor [Chitinivibrionales bacterium]MBD3395691.1 selenocysteine-specific translation elongation factor [Chitinivibrionales bacterium]